MVMSSEPHHSHKKKQVYLSTNELMLLFIIDDLRRHVWPRLVGIDPNCVEPAPNMQDLKMHPEYNQVILDVNRSLKRFPPGIPYEQRIALQDQLTVLILRVIIKYPHLRYYQVRY